MKHFAPNSCYFFYGKKWDSWEELCRNFQWEIPEKMNAAFLVCDAYADDAEKVAIYYEDHTRRKGRLTFSELKKNTNQLANYLNSQGLGADACVAVCTRQKPENIISHIATWKCGAVSMPLTVMFGIDGLKYRLAHSQTQIAIVEADVLDRVRELQADLPDLQHVLVLGEASLKEGEKDFWTALQPMPEDFAVVEKKSSDSLIIAYTSGTTGPPKGVLHRHSFILHSAHHYAILGNAEIREDDVFWHPADYAWMGSLFDLAFPALFYGRPIVTYSGERFGPEKAFQLIHDYGISIAYIPPTALRMMRQVDNPTGKWDISKLRTLMSGGESLGTALPQWIRKTFGPDTVIHEAYGQTEGTLLLGNCQKYFEYRQNLGKSLPGLEVEIIDKQGNVVPPGQPGEIAVKATDGNPIVFKEYWKDEEKTREKYVGEWMVTGDQGVKDEEGYFSFISRKDDIIISSGYRMGPSEIEDALTKHEAVLEAGVIGVPDELKGQVPKAYVVLKEGYQPSEDLKKDLREFVKTRLAMHEAPRHFAFISELPKTVVGKVKRKDLRSLD
ncbi:MAG: AMP-binding protein [Desulfobacteraceae bacterium]|nr:AMP-binding protein [Desulfobacteraceae bacterium]